MEALLVCQRSLKKNLKQLHRESYSSISDRGKNIEETLRVCQKEIQLDPLNDSLLTQEKELCELYCKFKSIELHIAYQKAKAHDIKMRDASTSYFFSKMAQRRNINAIHKLQDSNGNVCESLNDIVHAFLQYYEGNQALFSIDENKAPSLDTWARTGTTINSVVLEFFETGRMNRGMNSTIISLIPNMSCPNSVLDYRPISCCNTLYKVISKILTSRLKNAMPSLVGAEQAASVAGRSIFDNSLLNNELVKGYGRAGISPKCVIKVDIRKAFHSVSWTFLQDILHKMGLPDQFVTWIMTCVSSTHFSFSFNGSQWATSRRIEHWSTRQLSYAGMIQLLNSVIFRVENFWCACFLVPKGIIKAIDKDCRAFLWGSTDGRSRMIFFKWDRVCTKREQGGMGIKELLSWNKALQMKIFLRLTIKPDTIWAQWCRDEFLQGCRGLAAVFQVIGSWEDKQQKTRVLYEVFRSDRPRVGWVKPLLDYVVYSFYSVGYPSLVRREEESTVLEA
ncbi:uncharacterized protein LOC141590222 [Silene latifolia]|uniref:uncharacterized protein LOC141590222 n=1 Tax=Silene latifolia TaxID=37657 RepID=UPI003D7767E7